MRSRAMVKFGAGKIPNAKRGSAAQAKKFAQTLRGKKITGFGRSGKFLIIEISGGWRLVIHLRMTGQLIFIAGGNLKRPLLLSRAKRAQKELLPSKHTHVEIEFSGGGKLFYNDVRKFGHMRLANNRDFEKIMARAGHGMDALEINAAHFSNLLNLRPQKRIKDFLLDQTAIAGIGNIYADEALFAARISPLRKTGSLAPAESLILASAIKKILRTAINHGGSSLKNYVNARGAAGKFSARHKVYGKSGKPCRNCGKPLRAHRIGSRTATFCPNCQR